MSAEAAVLRSIHGTPVPLQGVTARGRLNGLLFELTVEQSYRNTGTANIEAVYTFPIPHHAVLLGLDLEIGERKLSGVAVRRKQATEQYEEAMDQGNTAALLEQAGDGLYTLSLGNLLAGEQAVIRYRYAQLVDRHEDCIRLCVPTVIAPRYGDPGAHGLRPHQIPAVELLAAYPFSLEIQVLGDQARAAFSSPSHTVQVAAMEGGMRVTLGKGAELDRDFVLQLAGTVTESATLTAPDGDGFVSLVSLDTRLPKDVARPLSLKLVVDCSGSMGGDSIAQARRALVAVLERLTPADAVSLTRFGSACETLTVPQAAGHSGWMQNLLNRRQQPPPSPNGARMAMAAPHAVEWLKHAVRGMQADLGGTELASALQAAIAIPGAADAGTSTCQDLLLVTDGEVWAVEQVVELAARSGHRLFVVAVGAAPAEGLARGLSEKTGGAVEFVSPNEDIEGAIVRMFNRMQEAPKHISSVNWPVQPLWTAPLPTMVFSGDTLHLIAGFRSVPVGEMRVTIAGTAEGNVTLRSPIAAVSSLEQLPRVAAARRLAELPEDEAATLAEKHQLVSRYTSFVVVQERAAGEKPAGLPILAAVPQMLAAGWGAVSNPARSLAPQMMPSVPAFGASADLDCFDAPSSRELRDMAHVYLGANSPKPLDELSVPEWLGRKFDHSDARPPRDILVALVANGPRRGRATLALLETLGVPGNLIDRLREWVAAGMDEDGLVRIFLAVLARSPAATALTPEQGLGLEGEVFTNRALRAQRTAVQQLLAGVTEDSWAGAAVTSG